MDCCKVSKDDYNKYLRDNVTAHYEKAPPETEKGINIEARDITDKLKISDRVEPIAHNEAYITIKDHKDEFPNVVKCRLINPAKSQIGRLSKEILQETNSTIRQTDRQKISPGQLKSPARHCIPHGRLEGLPKVQQLLIKG